ncbi:MAG: branched-chain amino acid ABC transporter [Rhizobiales bacterium PAR1]|nr:MAG: branched-chain amino acid ABC transporter [Rhizobiales bacterium PAR1]
MSNADFLILLAAMAAATYFCRAIGFLAMRYVPMTPRFEAALKATPISVMTAIVAIAAMRGGPPEWCATAAVLFMMKVSGNDIIAAFTGVGVIALMRAYGF